MAIRSQILKSIELVLLKGKSYLVLRVSMINIARIVASTVDQMNDLNVLY